MIKKCPKCKDYDYETMIEKCWKCGYEKKLPKNIKLEKELKELMK